MTTWATTQRGLDMARIAIFGGTGYVGGNIAREAAARGHQVTSYSRTEPTAPQDGVEYRTGSMYEAVTVADAAADADVVVISLVHAPADQPPLLDALRAAAPSVVAGGARLGLVGGAASSLVAEGGPRLLDGADFPSEWRGEATAAAEVLDWLRSDSPEQLDWFVVSPPGLFGSFAPGETLGTYRTGGDVLVTKEDGSSEISGTDYALAFVDEIEKPAHHRARVTVGH
jgi:putative NADH-flavin reductase